MSLESASPVLLAAAQFGVSKPISKLLVGDVPPLLLAGLLSLGSGIGLGVLLAMTRKLGAWRFPVSQVRSEWTALTAEKTY